MTEFTYDDQNNNSNKRLRTALPPQDEVLRGNGNGAFSRKGFQHSRQPHSQHHNQQHHQHQNHSKHQIGYGTNNSNSGGGKKFRNNFNNANNNQHSRNFITKVERASAGYSQTNNNSQDANRNRNANNINNNKNRNNSGNNDNNYRHDRHHPSRQNRGNSVGQFSPGPSHRERGHEHGRDRSRSFKSPTPDIQSRSSRERSSTPQFSPGRRDSSSHNQSHAQNQNHLVYAPGFGYGFDEDYGYDQDSSSSGNIHNQGTTLFDEDRKRRRSSGSRSASPGSSALLRSSTISVDMDDTKAQALQQNKSSDAMQMSISSYPTVAPTTATATTLATSLPGNIDLTPGSALSTLLSSPTWASTIPTLLQQLQQLHNQQQQKQVAQPMSITAQQTTSTLLATQGQGLTSTHSSFAEGAPRTGSEAASESTQTLSSSSQLLSPSISTTPQQSPPPDKYQYTIASALIPLATNTTTATVVLEDQSTASQPGTIEEGSQGEQLGESKAVPMLVLAASSNRVEAIHNACLTERSSSGPSSDFAGDTVIIKTEEGSSHNQKLERLEHQVSSSSEFHEKSANINTATLLKRIEGLNKHLDGNADANLAVSMPVKMESIMKPSETIVYAVPSISSSSHPYKLDQEHLAPSTSTAAVANTAPSSLSSSSLLPPVCTTVSTSELTSSTLSDPATTMLLDTIQPIISQPATTDVLEAQQSLESRSNTALSDNTIIKPIKPNNIELSRESVEGSLNDAVSGAVTGSTSRLTLNQDVLVGDMDANVIVSRDVSAETKFGTNNTHVSVDASDTEFPSDVPSKDLAVGQVELNNVASQRTIGIPSESTKGHTVEDSGGPNNALAITPKTRDGLEWGLTMNEQQSQQTVGDLTEGPLEHSLSDTDPSEANGMLSLDSSQTIVEEQSMLEQGVEMSMNKPIRSSVTSATSPQETDTAIITFKKHQSISPGAGVVTRTVTDIITDAADENVMEDLITVTEPKFDTFDSLQGSETEQSVSASKNGIHLVDKREGAEKTVVSEPEMRSNDCVRSYIHDITESLSDMDVDGPQTVPNVRSSSSPAPAGTIAKNDGWETHSQSNAIDKMKQRRRSSTSPWSQIDITDHDNEQRQQRCPLMSWHYVPGSDMAFLSAMAATDADLERFRRESRWLEERIRRPRWDKDSERVLDKSLGLTRDVPHPYSHPLKEHQEQGSDHQDSSYNNINRAGTDDASAAKMAVTSGTTSAVRLSSNSRVAFSMLKTNLLSDLEEQSRLEADQQTLLKVLDRARAQMEDKKKQAQQIEEKLRGLLMRQAGLDQELLRVRKMEKDCYEIRDQQRIQAEKEIQQLEETLSSLQQQQQQSQQ
ncbi:hypothetical protein BX616_003752 [Lobosporangium transversale]|nr:hypothetical protein BX616_003752 [Lobosporangium transversale]